MSSLITLKIYVYICININNLQRNYVFITVKKKNIYLRRNITLPEQVRSNRYPRRGWDKAIWRFGYSCPRSDGKRRRCIDNWRKTRVAKSPKRGRDCIERRCHFPPSGPWSPPCIPWKIHTKHISYISLIQIAYRSIKTFSWEFLLFQIES